MSVNIKLKRSGVAGKIPTTSSLELGEIALNTNDGRAFMKQQVGSTQTVVEFATTAGSGSTVTSASYANYATNAGFATNAGNANTANFATSASYSDNASSATSASYALNSTSASYALTASHAPSAASSSYALSASYAATSSYAIGFNVSGNLFVGGDITAQTLHVQFITSSVIYSSGSNVFGDSIADTQTLNGTVNVSGSFNVTGSATINNLTGSLFGTASWASNAQNATTSSYANVATSASYAASASNSISGAYAVNSTTSSYANDATTASYAATATSGAYAVNATTASYANVATSASYSATATSGAYAVNATTSSYANDATSASYAASASNAISGGYAVYSTTASYANVATSASYALNSTSGAYAVNSTTSSYANDATSASYAASASNSISGAYAVNATSASYAPNATTSSYALSSSYAFDATSASYAVSTSNALAAQTASYVQNAQTASYVLNAVSASYAASASNALSASNAVTAQTASYANNFTVTGTLTAQTIVVQTITSSQELITGSLIVSGALNAYGGITGSLFGTASFANSASYALNSELLDGLDSTAFASTTSYNAFTQSYYTSSSSFDTRILANSSSIGLLSSSFLNFSSSFNTGSFTGSFRGAFTGSFSGSLFNLNGIKNYIPVFDSTNTISSSIIYQSASYIAINENNFTAEHPEALYVFQTNPTSYNAITARGNSNNYLQLNIQNTNLGISASSDVVATANNGTEEDMYIDMGINNENYTYPGGVGAANDTYVYGAGKNFHIGNTKTGHHLGFFVGGFDSDVYRKFQLNATSSHEMSGSLNISGSLIVRNGITGSLFGTSSWALNSITSSYAVNSTSASYALTAAYASNVPLTASYAISASNAITASYAIVATSASYAAAATSGAYSVNATSASYALTASYAANVPQTASYAISSSNALTASYVNPLRQDVQISGSLGISGSGTVLSANVDTIVFTGSFLQSGSVNVNGNITTTGTITAQTLNVQVITSSVDFVTGSTRFGTLLANTHQFTGSVSVTGSLAVNNSAVILSSQTSSMSVLSAQTASYVQNAQSSSYVLNAVSASYAASASNSLFAQTASYWSGSITNVESASYAASASNALAAQTASYVQNAQSASYWSGSIINAVSASYAASASNALAAQTASYAITASFALNGGGTGLSALYIQDEGTTQGTASYINFTGDGVTATVAGGTASINIPGGGGGGGGIIGQNAILNQSSAAATWSFSHNLGTQFPVFTIFDSNNNVIIPQQIYAQNTSSALIYFSSARTGTAVAALGGGIVSSSYAISASYSNNATSASYALNADKLDGKDSTEFATTGSNTFIGTQTVTGSLITSGSNTLIGNTTLTGSINMSGSITASSDVNIGGILKLKPAIDPGNFNETSSYLFTSASNTETGFDLYYRQQDNLVKFKWLEGGISTGLLYGGTISYSGSTIFVKPGSGIINNNNASTGSEISPIFTYVNWGPYTASATYLTSSQNTYLYVDASGSIFQQTSFFNQTQYEQAIPLGRVTHPNFSSITGVGSNVQTTYDSDTQQNDFIRAFGPIKVSGFAINVHTGSLGLGIGSGIAYNLGGFYTQDPNSPSHYESAGFATGSIARAWRSGSGVYLDNNGGAFYNTVDPDYWDDGTGTLNTMNAGDWQIQRVFANPVTGRVVVYYGQTGTYSNLLNALQYLATDPFEEGEFTAKSLVFVGYLVLKGQTNNLADNTNNRIINAGIFRNIAGGSSGGSAVAQTLNDLSDVVITTPSNGQALIYDSGNWINGISTSASYAVSASNTLTAQTASFVQNAQTASYILNAVSASYAASASNSLFAQTASYVENAQTASYVLNAVSASYAASASNTLFAQTASYWSGSIINAATASYVQNAQTASYVQNAQSASYILNAVSASHANSASNAIAAQTASSADNFTVRGTLTAQTLVVQTITSSVIYSSGSNVFGNDLANTQVLTGSVSITGSLAVNGSNVILSNQTSSMSVATASQATNVVGTANRILFNSAANTTTTSNNLTWEDSINLMTLGSATGIAGTISKIALYTSSFGGYGLGVSPAQLDYVSDGSHVFYKNGVIPTELVRIANNGDVNISGSLNVINGITGNLTGTASTASYWSGSIVNAATASFVQTAQTASFVTLAQTASYWSGSIQNAVSAAFADLATSSSYAATASFALNGGGGGISAIYIADEGTLQGTASYFDFTGAGVTATVSAGTASINITSGGSTTVTGSNIVLNQSVSAATWSFDHNLNTQYPVFQVFNSSNEVIIPERIVAVNTASALIYFPVSLTGKAVASVGGFNGSASYAATSTTSSYALTSSYSLTGTGFPFSGSAVITGSLLVSGSGITGDLSGTASFATTASYSLFALSASNAPGFTVQFSQASAATTWSFTHNLNTRNPIVQVYDTNYKQIIPNDIVGTDANTAEIRFDYAQSGYAVMSNGGGLYVTGSTSELSQSIAAVTWSFNHNLNSKYVNFTVYDSSDYVIIPANIRAIDSNSAELHFATSQTGRAIAQFSGINGAPNATTASYALTSSYATTLTLDRSLLDYALVNSSTVGSNNVFTQATGSYTSMFINYTAASGSNARAGHVTAVWNGGTVEFNDVSTADIGTTTAVTSSVVIVSGDAQFNIQTNTSGWRIKSTVTFI